MTGRKISLTRPELKRQREQLRRFERYLPMLKLKQQQLQQVLLDISKHRQAVGQSLEAARRKVDSCRILRRDVAGLNVAALGIATRVIRGTGSVAGVTIPVLLDVTFAPLEYSLFGTPPWVDGALTALRDLAEKEAELKVLVEQQERIEKELRKVIQRVNLFEKVKIPGSRVTMRRIRIRLGDEMAAGVGRAKIAKSRLVHAESVDQGGAPMSGPQPGANAS